MSGAGRGTPRISPSAIGGVFEDETLLQVVNSEKFQSAIVNTPPNELVLNSNYQQYIAASIGPGGGFLFPNGAIRGLASIKYTEGAVGGAVDFYFGFDYVLNLCAQASNGVLVGDRQIIEMRRIGYRLRDTGDRFYEIPFVFPPVFGDRSRAVSIFATESGVPATPGTITVLRITVDNLAENSVLPTIVD